MDFKFNLKDNGIEDLTQYNIVSKSLKDDIRNKKIPYSEVLERKDKLFDLIPTCWIVDDFGLYALIDEVYANDPEHKEYTDNLFGRNIEIKPMDDEEIEAYLKKITKKFKEKL